MQPHFIETSSQASGLMLLLCLFYWWGNWEPKPTFLSSLSCVHAEPSTQSSARSVAIGHTPLHCHLRRAGLRHVSHLTPTVHQDLLKWESELVNFLLTQESASCASCPWKRRPHRVRAAPALTCSGTAAASDRGRPPVRALPTLHGTCFSSSSHQAHLLTPTPWSVNPAFSLHWPWPHLLKF